MIPHDFELIQERDIPELNCRGRYFRHIPSGAELLKSLTSPSTQHATITSSLPPGQKANTTTNSNSKSGIMCCGPKPSGWQMLTCTTKVTKAKIVKLIHRICII